jgi:gluconolactonase
MLTMALFVALFSADANNQRLAVLRTFRDEFVSVPPLTPGGPPLAVAKYEVTQQLWQAVMGNNPSRWRGPRNSVEMINFHEAQAFCSQVTKELREAGLIESSQVVRLPAEAEWEHAARAGTTTKYSFGDDAAQLGDYAWFNGNAAGNDPPVGAKKPNPWGLYDVHGYLWEWTDPTDHGRVPLGRDGGRASVVIRTHELERLAIRGGSWKDQAEDLAFPSRRLVEPTLRDDAVGLRCVLTSTQAGAENQAVRPADIVPPGAQLEPLWTEGEFTEGPALAPDGSIFFSDIGQSIYRYDPATGKTELFRRPSGRANGLMFNAAGELIACEGANTGGNRRISITTGIMGGQDGKVETLAERYEGKRFNSPNDLAMDGVGRVYFTDPRYVGNEPRELDFEAVFLIALDRTVKLATREVSKPNGILVSPDGRTVYVSDNHPQGSRQLVAFSIQPDGTLSDKRVLHDFGAGRGVDGMTLDQSGNIFAAAGTGDKAAIYVFDPAGKLLATIPTPGDPTNCVFGGGADGSSLYVTCANSKQPGTKYGLYRITLGTRGHHVVRLQ